MKSTFLILMGKGYLVYISWCGEVRTPEKKHVATVYVKELCRFLRGERHPVVVSIVICEKREEFEKENSAIDVG